MKKLLALLMALALVFALAITASAEESGEMPMGPEKLYYAGEEGQFQYIQVYLPEGEAPEGGWPVAVCVPGGGFNVCANAPMDAYKTNALENGVAIITVNYRAFANFGDILAGSMPPGPGGLSPELTDRTEIAMEMASDVKAALRYITANAADLGVNADQILLTGDSAGGGLAAYITYGQEDFEGFSIAACAGWAPANHDVWSDQDWSRSAACADENDAPYYLLTGTHDFVCVADTRAIGFVNLMLEKGVNVNFTIVPDAIHMDDTTGNPYMFFTRAIELGMEDLLWDWFASVLDGTLADAPESYELAYDPATVPETPDGSMAELEALVIANYPEEDESPKTGDNSPAVVVVVTAMVVAATALVLLKRNQGQQF